MSKRATMSADLPVITNTTQLEYALSATSRTAGIVANASYKLRELRMSLRNAQFVVIDLLTEEEKATFENTAVACTDLIDRLETVMQNANASVIEAVQKNRASVADTDALNLSKFVSKAKTQSRQSQAKNSSDERSVTKRKSKAKAKSKTKTTRKK